MTKSSQTRAYACLDRRMTRSRKPRPTSARMLALRLRGRALAFGWLTAGAGFVPNQIFLFPALLEIGLVPASALETKPGRGNQFFQFRLTAFRTIGQRIILDTLNNFKLVATGLALILIDWHSEPPDIRLGQMISL